MKNENKSDRIYKKQGKKKKTPHIETIRGRGYELSAEEAIGSRKKKGKSQLPDKNEKETTYSQLISSIPLLAREGER